MNITALALIAACGLLAAGSGGPGGPAGRQEALASLIEAERAFSRASEAEGIRAAFLTWLAPDAKVFRPAPVDGRPLFEKMDPAHPACLAWEPEIAEVAASGELGYTSGPYRIGPGRGAEPTGFGHYVSVWKKQPGGSWRVLLDIGVAHGRPEPRDEPGLTAATGSVSPARTLAPEKFREEEHAFGVHAGSLDREAAKKGMRRALRAFATEDVRVLRPGRFPAIGRRAASALLPAGTGRMSRASEPLRTSFEVGMAWSGDLAYSYGTVGSGDGGAASGTTAFLRIWRREAGGTWKVCLDAALPVTPS